jgi:hypothetical protein
MLQLTSVGYVLRVRNSEETWMDGGMVSRPKLRAVVFCLGKDRTRIDHIDICSQSALVSFFDCNSLQAYCMLWCVDTLEMTG